MRMNTNDATAGNAAVAPVARREESVRRPGRKPLGAVHAVEDAHLVHLQLPEGARAAQERPERVGVGNVLGGQLGAV